MPPALPQQTTIQLFSGGPLHQSEVTPEPKQHPEPAQEEHEESADEASEGAGEGEEEDAGEVDAGEGVEGEEEIAGQTKFFGLRL